MRRKDKEMRKRTNNNYNERYVPKRLRDEKKDHYWEDELGKCTSIIKVRWTMMIIMIQRFNITILTSIRLMKDE